MNHSATEKTMPTKIACGLMIASLMALVSCSGTSTTSVGESSVGGSSTGVGGVGAGAGGSTAGVGGSTAGVGGSTAGVGGSTGGKANTGGAVGSGGVSSTGGSMGAGGRLSTGGAAGNGGALGTGGSIGTGGKLSTGGSMGTGGKLSTGGVAGNGGALGSGGKLGSGGATSTGGSATIPGGFTDSEIIWRDEFDGTGLPDQTKWQIMQWKPGTVNNEVQAYTNSTDNLNQTGGVLNITALSSNGVTSGRIESKTSWAPTANNSIVYRIETRAMMAAGRGSWPAYWMLGNEQGPYGGWPNCGEIDIFEYIGNSHYFQCAVHDAYMRNHTMKAYSPQSPETQWHVYALNFYGDRLEFYVDSVLFNTLSRPATWTATNWPFTNQDGNSLRVILNLAIGGMMGGTVNYADFPMVQRFDYVRVYKKGS